MRRTQSARQDPHLVLHLLLGISVGVAALPSQSWADPVLVPEAPVTGAPIPDGLAQAAPAPAVPVSAPPASLPPASENPGHTLPYRRPTTAAYIVVGLAAVGATVGTIFGLKAISAKRDFDNGDRTTDRVEVIEKDALLADMAFGATLTLGVIGAVLWFTHREETILSEKSRKAPTITIAPLASASGGGATAVVHFR